MHRIDEIGLLLSDKASASALSTIKINVRTCESWHVFKILALCAKLDKSVWIVAIAFHNFHANRRLRTEFQLVLIKCQIVYFCCGIELRRQSLCSVETSYVIHADLFRCNGLCSILGLCLEYLPIVFPHLLLVCACMCLHLHLYLYL